MSHEAVAVIFGGTRIGNREMFMPANGLEPFLDILSAQAEQMALDPARVSATCRPYLDSIKYADVLARWNAVADGEGVSAAELAYRWVACHSVLSPEQGDALVIGASSPKQLEDTLSGIDKGPLSDAACAKVDNIWEFIRT